MVINISQDDYISVTQMNTLIKNHLNARPDFKRVYVRGEVSGAKVSKTGHLYFDLKDESSKIKCVAYYRVRVRLPFKVEDGMELLVIGKIDVYKERGEYEIVVNRITEDGLGQLYVRLQQLRKALKKEGLFDIQFKKPLPVLPKRIGVVTSEGGAVIRDIIKTIRQRKAPCEIYIFPSLVQGRGSVEQLVCQIKRADDYGLDALIVGRGGGSLEDLMSFNDEKVIRSVFECKTPVISAVGHETDFTLTDDVADIRAHTPTDASNKIVNRIDEVESRLSDLNSRLVGNMTMKLTENRNDLNLILSKAVFSQKDYIYYSSKCDFEKLSHRFDVVSNDMVKTRRNSLEKIASEYVIKRPCKIQLDIAKSNLAELQNRLVDAMDLIINNCKGNLDMTVANFNVSSERLVVGQRHRLDGVRKSYFIENPYVNLNKSRNQLEETRDRLIKSTNLNLDVNKTKFDNIKDSYKVKSNELVVSKSHELELISSSTVIKNHLGDGLAKNHEILDNLEQRLIKSFDHAIKENKKDLEIILNRKVVKNPALILSGYKSKIKENKEKLDKINQVLNLEREKQNQKSRMVKIIVVIVVVFVIIILLLIFGGI